MQNNKCTLFTLLKEHKIIIPKMQRDYAQGRNDKIIEEMTRKFVKVILDSINTQKPLHLDFIYGYIDDANKNFIPIDGQQRLTTLWLVYLYIYKLCNEDAGDEILQTFEKFSYETRTNSKKFCEFLVRDFAPNQETSIRNNLVDTKSFLHTYLNDPTVSAMINTLEIIRLTLKGYNLETLQNSINQEGKVITFSILDVSEDLGIENSEELYIKMNSRGKQLSDWDNYKASLFEYIKHNGSINEEQKSTFIDWIEKDFLDFFWEKVDEKKDTEDRMKLFFERFMVLQGIYSEKYEKLEEIKLGFDEYITEENISAIQKFFELLKSDIKYENGRFGNDLRKQELINALCNSEFSLGDHELLSAYFIYANSPECKANSFDELFQIMRILKNTQEPYRNTFQIVSVSIPTMKSIIESQKNILDYFANDDGSINLGSYSKVQIDEEKVKAKLILESEEWRHSIYEAESHEYLNGTIGFLLKMCSSDDIYDLNKFRGYYAKFKEYFGEEGIKDRKNISEILKYGTNFMLDESFPHNRRDGGDSNQERDRSWRTYFRKIGIGIDGESELKKFFDKANEDINMDILDWRYWFIKVPDLFEKIGKRRIDFSSQSDLVGIPWNYNVFSGKYKHDIPLFALSLKFPNNVEYTPFYNRFDEVCAHWNNRKILFDYDNNKYRLEDDNAEYSFDEMVNTIWGVN